jgi:hypothetical protein
MCVKGGVVLAFCRCVLKLTLKIFHVAEVLKLWF